MARFGRSFPFPWHYYPALRRTPQILRPVSDISAGAWIPSAGSDLYAMLDETPPDDSDYIVTTSPSTSEVKVFSGADPLNSAGHIVRYRAKGNNSTLTVYLMQGATVIATHVPALTTVLQLFTFALSAAEADAITDYADLRLRFVSS